MNTWLSDMRSRAGLWLWVATHSPRMRLYNILYPIPIATNLWFLIQKPETWVLHVGLIAFVIFVYMTVLAVTVSELRGAAQRFVGREEADVSAEETPA